MAKRASPKPVAAALVRDPSKVTIDGVELRGLGYDRVETMNRASFQDSSMVVIVPTRTPQVETAFVQVFQNLSFPMNGTRAMFWVTGAEVGKAYDEAIRNILAHPVLSTYKYVLTVEDDTLPPPNGVEELIKAIEQGPYDGVGGMYFTKGDYNAPMVYGNPAEFARTGVLDFRPRDVASGLKAGAIIECNGIANGFTLFRLSAFRDVEPPYFQTLNEHGVGAMTQDLFWCAKARRAGKKFAVHCGVRCIHADWANRKFY